MTQHILHALVTFLLIPVLSHCQSNRTARAFMKHMPDSLTRHDHPMQRGGGEQDRNRQIEYYLYNRRFTSKDDELILMNIDGTVPRGIWNENQPVKVLVHGFINTMMYSSVHNRDLHDKLSIAKAYAATNATVNIIFVDWAELASLKHNYPKVVKHTRKVGRDLATMLSLLYLEKAFHHWDDIHIIGFSLGAHVSGIAGMYIQKLSEGQWSVGRISGLDPAGPKYDKPGGLPRENLTYILDREDAQFVDVIHCNMGDPPNYKAALLTHGLMGSMVQAGHADFYPNGGSRQKYQCTENMDRMTCSHMMCVEFWIVSIYKNKMLACPCPSWESFENGACACDISTGAELMGDPCSRQANGKYYLEVKSNEIQTTLPSTVSRQDNHNFIMYGSFSA